MSQRRLVEIVLQGKDQSKGAFDSLANSLGMADVKMLKFAAGAAGVATAMVAATKQVYEFTAEMAATGDALDKLSARTGIAVESLSEFEFMLERGGGSAGDLEPAIRRLTRAMSDAREGIKESADAFAALGMNTSDLVDGSGNLRSVESLLPQIADGLKGISSQAERMDVAQAIFGRGGTMLLPMLQQGEAGIRAMREEMQKYGGAMSTQFAAKSAEFMDAQTNLSEAASRLKEALAEPFLVPFTNAINRLAEEIAKGVRHFGGSGEVATFIGDGSQPGGPQSPQQAPERRMPAGYGWAEWYDWEQRPRDDMDYDFGLPPNIGVPSGPRRAYAEPDWESPETWRTGEFPDELGIQWTGQTDLLKGMKDGIVAFEAEWSDASLVVSSTFQSAMASAMTSAVLDADNAAEAIKNIFASAAASIASQFISAGIFALLGLPVAGPFSGVFGGGGKAAGGSLKSVSAATKAMPGQIALGGYGNATNMALQAAAKGYV